MRLRTIRVYNQNWSHIKIEKARLAWAIHLLLHVCPSIIEYKVEEPITRRKMNLVTWLINFKLINVKLFICHLVRNVDLTQKLLTSQLLNQLARYNIRMAR